MEISDLEFLANEKHRIIRQIIRFISTEDFTDVFALCTEEEKRNVLTFVDETNMVGVRQWYIDQCCKQCLYWYLTIKDLRRLAGKNKIDNYQYMDKTELIFELESYDGRNAENNASLHRGD